MNSLIKKSILPLAGAALLLAANNLHAADPDPLVFTVDLNTAVLASAPNGPFYLDFQLNAGGVNSDSTAVISNFTFTGGGPVGQTVVTSSGGTVSGDMSSHLTINDAVGFNDVYQGFSSDTTDIKFTVSLTQKSSGVTPDAFEIAVLNSLYGNPAQIWTTDPNEGLSLVSLDLGTTSNPATLSDIRTYVSYGGPADQADGDGGVTASVEAAPEPSTWALFALTTGLVGFLRWRKKMA